MFSKGVVLNSLVSSKSEIFPFVDLLHRFVDLFFDLNLFLQNDSLFIQVSLVSDFFSMLLYLLEKIGGLLIPVVESLPLDFIIFPILPFFAAYFLEVLLGWASVVNCISAVLIP
jgi:hypothetical protein